MPLLGRRNLPPPQPRRVLPPRSLRFGSSYKAPPSSDDQWQPGQSSSSPSATGEDGSQAPAASVGAGSGGERVDSPASPSVVGPPAALDVVGIDPPRASSNRTRPVLAIAGTSRPHAESSPTPPLRPVSPSLARSPSLSSPGTTPPPGPAARRESKSLPTTRGSTDSGQGESKVSKVTVKAGSKVYQCSGYGDCSMVFTRAEHLARHIRGHTGLKPFACHCAKTFSRIDNLRQHCATIHPLHKALNESTIAALRQQQKTLASGTTADIQKFAKRADESLGIKLLRDSAPSRPAVSLTASEEVELEIERALVNPTARTSTYTAKRKYANPSDEDRAGQAKRPSQKKVRREQLKLPATAPPPFGPGINAVRGSSRGPSSALPPPKPQAASRFSSVRRATPSTTQAYSPFTPEIVSPATPVDGRPGHLVKIARSRGTGGTADSPYLPPHRLSGRLYVDDDDDDANPRRKSSASVSERARPPSHRPTSNVRQFTRRQFDELKYADDSPESPALTSHRRAKGSAPLLPAAVLIGGPSSQSKAAAASETRRPPQDQSQPRSIPSVAPTASRSGHGAYNPNYQARPARRFTLPHQAFAERYAHGGWGDGPYSADYSLSSARTRMSSGISHGRQSSGAGAALDSSGYAGASVWSTRASAPRVEGPGRSLAFGSGGLAPTPGRTVHSPQKPTSAPRVRFEPTQSGGQSALMDLAVEMSRPRPPRPLQPPPLQAERSPSPVGVLWGDASQDGAINEDDHPPAESRYPGHDGPDLARPNSSFPEPFSADPTYPMPHQPRRYESAFSPPPPPPPAYWYAPYHAGAFPIRPYVWPAQPMHAPPPFACYHMPPAFDQHLAPDPPVDYECLADGRPRFGGGPMLSALSPHVFTETPPAVTGEHGLRESRALDLGQSTIFARRMLPTARAAVDVERAESVGFQAFHSPFAQAFEARHPQGESAVVSPAACM